ncbi:MAG TPA: right-handed parallel beta-helix repeat-containing protein [Planctomycetes bacterium]|nr:right-handed parallel beta-helix repeat-containing protein [Planctomycetota bacterium]
MKNLIFVISLLLFTFASICYGDESTTTATAEGLTLIEILNQAGVAEPNEVNLSSNESIVTETLTILLEMFQSACTENPDGCNDGTDETVNAIMDMIKQVLFIYNDTTTAATEESETSEITAGEAVECNSEIPEEEPLMMEGMETLRIPANTVLTGDVVWEGEVILEGWVFLPGAYDPNDSLADPNDQLVYDPNEELVSFTIKPGTYIHSDPCEYDIGIWLSPGHNIKWNGLPDNRILFSFVPEVPDWNNWHGIVIEGEPAGFEMNYCDIQFATNGIYQFGVGDLKIQNNRFWGCNTGVVKNGPGKIEIANNAFQETWDTGIDVFMERALEPNYLSEASNDTEVIITNNTIVGSYYEGMGQNYGIVVHGVSDFEDAGIVEIANNLVVSSYACAIVQEGGYMLCQGRKNNAYWNNNLNVNPGNPIPDVNGVDLLYDPFEYYYDSGTTFLWRESEAVDGGLFEVDETPLVYMSTSVDGKADTGMLDIGYHWTAWDWSNDGLILDADVNEDYVVDCNDLYYLSLSWLEDPNVPPDPNDYPGGVLPTDPNLFYLFPNKRADINEDMIVDYVDFALFSKQWLWESVPGIGKIDAEFDQDPCNLSGIVTVTFNTYGADPPVTEIITLMDGLPVEDGECSTDFLPYDVSSPTIGFDTREHENGRCELKFIGLRPDAPAVCSSVIPVTFNNQHTNVKITRDDNYTYIFASPDANSTATVRIIDPRYESGTEEVVIEEVFTGRIATRIPDSYIQRPDLPYNVIIDWDDGGEKSGGEVTEADIERIIKRGFDKKDFPLDAFYTTLVSVGNGGWLNWRRSVMGSQEHIYKTVIRESELQGHPCIFIHPTEKVKEWPFKTLMDNFDIIKYCLYIYDVSRWVHFSHGSYEFRSKEDNKIYRRQNIDIGNKRVFSHLYTDYSDEDRPPGLIKLPDNLEKCHSLRELGFWQEGWHKLTWVEFKACESGVTEEFPENLGMLDGGQPEGGSIFCGWKIKIPQNDSASGNKYNLWDRQKWEYLGQGNMLRTAKTNALENPEKTGITQMEINAEYVHYGVDDQYAWWNWPSIGEGY